MNIIKDTSTIARIVVTIALSLRMNGTQERTLNNYVKMMQNEWIAECRREEEIEYEIKRKANEIIRNS